MCFGSTRIYRTKDFSSRARPTPAASSTRTRPAPARKAVRVPAPAAQMRVPATRAG